MFEKEAEEYADKDFALYEPTDHERFTKENDWRNGAEYGYNKANEWHFVKDGDLPDTTRLVVVKYENEKEEDVDKFHYPYGWESVMEGYYDYDPIAWCEIPKFEGGLK